LLECAANLVELFLIPGFFDNSQHRGSFAACIANTAIVGRANKKPRGVSGGAKCSFLSKEVTANTVTGDRAFLLLLDSDLLVFVVIFLLASKSCS